jgi:ribosomal protein L11 methyltransferase
LFPARKEPISRPMVDNAPTTPAQTVRLVTDRTTAERLASFLTEALDEQEVVTAAFESAEGSWTMAVYFSDPPNQTALRALVALEAGAEAANALIFEQVEQKDWVAASLEGLKPVEAGRFFVHGQHDRGKVRANHIRIEIEAALAFGTGHHGTTRGCLLALDFIAKQPGKPRRILDVGTGTGVLAIAAARAWKMRVLASDIDPLAVKVARENAYANEVGSTVEMIHAAGLNAHRFRQRGPYDLVLANILLGPLVRLAPLMRPLLAPNARVVLSGLLDSHAHTALMAYRAQGLMLEKRIRLEGWTTLILRRPALPR